MFQVLKVPLVIKICKMQLPVLLSYSRKLQLANNFIGATNENLEKNSFWQSSVSSSKHGSVSTSGKSPVKEQAHKYQ